MAQVTVGGNPIRTVGTLPEVGAQAPEFRVSRTNLTTATLDDFRGKRMILNIFPSVDTGVCAASVRRFNETAAILSNTVVLCVSRDLPFAHKRFCEAEGIANVIPLSDMRDGSFGRNYGVAFADGKLEGLLSRAVVVTNESGVVVHAEQVAETGHEPNYDAALAALK